MAINPETQYPGKIAPSSPEYPYGAARNITAPGDGTGTPWEAALVNDLFGFQQALLAEVDIVPSGSPDKVGASQYLQAVYLTNNQTNVKAFDAKGDGISDDTAAIQGAIDYVSDAFGGGSVFLPAGIYLISSSLIMKANVSLSGPPCNPTIESLHDPINEGFEEGLAVIRPSVAVADRAVHFDFTLADRAKRPYNTVIQYLYLDGVSMTSGNGVETTPPPSGEGVFNNGKAGRAVSLRHCGITRFPKNGIRVENIESPARRVGIDLYSVRVGFSGEDNVYLAGVFDAHVGECAFFSALDGSNFYHTNCAGLRFHRSDFFSAEVGARAYSGNGITDDSNVCIYDECYIDNNYGNGLELVSINNTKVDRRTRILSSLISANGGDYLDTATLYDNVRIGTIGGDSIRQITFADTTFGGDQFRSTGLPTVTHHINQVAEVTAIEGGNFASGCVFRGALDLLDDTAAMSLPFWQQTTFSGCMGTDLLEVTQKQYDMADSGGGLWTPSCRGGAVFLKTNNSLATDFRNFSYGPDDSQIQGREIVVEFGDANTTLKFSSGFLVGNNSVDQLMPVGSVAYFKSLPTKNKWAVTLVLP